MNRHLLRLCCSIAFACLCFASSAQAPNGISLPKIIPPGPTSQELQRFLGYSGDGSTGTTNVSIPLYTLSLPGLSVPFSLRYNSSGIKVNQSPGVAGYGWTLFPGLKITRTVMGKSDIPFKTNHIGQYYPYNMTGAPIEPWQIATPSSGGDNDGKDDGQYDIFTIHLPNYNGSFILQWDGSVFTAVSIPDSPLKIVPVSINSGSSITGFTVTDDKGIVYTFGTDMEFSTDGGDPLSWMLHSITLPGVNNTITFSYADSQLNRAFAEPVQSFTIWDNITNMTGTPVSDFNISRYFFSGSSSGGYATSAAYPSEYVTSPDEKVLSAVSFPGGSMQFTYQSNSYTNSSLQRMTVLDADFNTVKAINFTVNSNNVLQTVAVNGEGAYNMQYRPQSAHSVFDQDRWGYFNNKGNTTLVPQMTLNIVERDPLNTVYPTNTVPVTIPGANRDVDTAAMQVNMLQKIIYPTGGWSSFYYEPHAFMHNNMVTYGGGLRVKEIDTYDPVSKRTITKTYKYGVNASGQYGGESGLANLESFPEDDSFIDARELYAEDSPQPTQTEAARCRRLTINSQSHYRYFGFNTNIWYSQVSEYSSGGGKTVYYYNYIPNAIQLLSYSVSCAGCAEPNFDLGHKVDMLQTLNSLVYSSPDLIKKDTYSGLNGQYTLLKESQYNYALYHNWGGSPILINGAYTGRYGIPGLIVNPMCYILNSYYQPAPPLHNQDWSSVAPYWETWTWTGNNTPFLSSKYIMLTGTNAMVSTVDIDYANGQSATVTINNSYDSTYPFNKTAVQSTTSDGGTLNENYYYPTSTNIPNLNATQQAAVAMLNSNNRLTTVVAKSSFKNSTPISGEIFQYQDWGNNILAPQSIYTQKGTNGFEPRLQYNSYDTRGNVQSVSKTNGPKVCYVYGYGGAYPIAKIENADYAAVQSALGGQVAVENFRNNQTPTNGDVGAFLAPLRTIANAQVTTYTYAPLVGMTSSTDPKGLLTFYEYDSAGRLINVRDQNANILKHLDYHYKQ